MKLLLWLCAALFGAAVVGAITCGEQLAQSGLAAERETHLRHLIYFHFVLSQISILGGVFVLYWGRYRAQRNHLIISYNEKGMGLLPPGIRLRPHTTYHCCLGHMEEATLPPANQPIVVYPMFMQSGVSSGERLVAELKAAYALRGESPQLYIQAVVGATPWLVEKVGEELLSRGGSAGVLIVAHGAASGQAAAPEPELFSRRLGKILGEREIALATIGTAGSILDEMVKMDSEEVILLPFLMVEGMHYHQDLPTVEAAAARGKRLSVMPVVGSWLKRSS